MMGPPPQTPPRLKPPEKPEDFDIALGEGFAYLGGSLENVLQQLKGMQESMMGKSDLLVAHLKDTVNCLVLLRSSVDNERKVMEDIRAELRNLNIAVGGTGKPTRLSDVARMMDGKEKGEGAAEPPTATAPTSTGRGKGGRKPATQKPAPQPAPPKKEEKAAPAPEKKPEGEKKPAQAVLSEAKGDGA